MSGYLVRWKFGPNSLLNPSDKETHWYQHIYQTKDEALGYYISQLRNVSPSMAYTIEIFELVQLIPGKDESKLSPVLEKVVKQIPPKKRPPVEMRNKRIKDMWASGKTRREIATHMGISYQTVYSVTGPDKNGGNNPDKKGK